MLVGGLTTIIVALILLFVGLQRVDSVYVSQTSSPAACAERMAELIQKNQRFPRTGDLCYTWDKETSKCMKGRAGDKMGECTPLSATSGVIALTASVIAGVAGIAMCAMHGSTHART